MLNLVELFESFDDEYGKFNLIVNKFSNRKDLHAFILLDKLFPEETMDIISAAEHDEIFLEIDLEKLAERATEEDILNLVRCSIRLSDFESLTMYV